MKCGMKPLGSDSDAVGFVRDVCDEVLEEEVFGPFLAVKEVDGGLLEAADFANQKCRGTLSCTVLHPQSLNTMMLVAVVDKLDYGSVAVNVWSAFGYTALARGATWGAHHGDDARRVRRHRESLASQTSRRASCAAGRCARPWTCPPFRRASSSTPAYVGARTRRGRRGFRSVPTVVGGAARGSAGRTAGRRRRDFWGAAAVIFVMLVCFLTLAWFELSCERPTRHLYCKQATKRDPNIAERFKTLPALPHCRPGLRAAERSRASSRNNKGRPQKIMSSDERQKRRPPRSGAKGRRAPRSSTTTRSRPSTKGRSVRVDKVNGPSKM